MKKPTTEAQIENMSLKQMAELISYYQLKGIDPIKNRMKDFLKNKLREGKI